MVLESAYFKWKLVPSVFPSVKYCSYGLVRFRIFSVSLFQLMSFCHCYYLWVAWWCVVLLLRWFGGGDGHNPVCKDAYRKNTSLLAPLLVSVRSFLTLIGYLEVRHLNVSNMYTYFTSPNVTVTPPAIYCGWNGVCGALIGRSWYSALSTYFPCERFRVGDMLFPVIVSYSKSRGLIRFQDSPNLSINWRIFVLALRVWN